MVLAHLVAPHRWRGLRSFVLSRPFAEKLSPASRAKEIYPIHPPNPAVFEESLGDIPAVRDTAKSRLQVLQNVVAKRDWTLATRLRDEMLENGQHIPLDSVYEEGAIASLSLPQSFSKWLQLYPNAENGPSNPLTSLRATLLDSTSVDPSLVFEFGLIMAEKGYHSIVRQEILPHISRAAGTDAMTARLKTLLLPSVLAPSPSPFFLEDEDLADYTAFVPTPWAQPNNRVHSGDILTHLQSLLQDRKLIQAEIVLREIQDLGIDIPSSLVYLKAAETVLHPEYRGELPFQHFEKWFSLVPACHESPLEEFTTVRQRIFWSPATNMHLVIPFLLVCARKGYFGILTQHMDALRYAADDVVLSVYTDIQHHSKAYLTSLNKRESSVPAMLRKLHRRILSVLSKANRHELAARVLHSADAEVVSPLLSVLSKDNLSTSQTIEPGASSPKRWADSHSEERLEDLLQLASFSSMADKFQTDTPMVFDTPREYVMYLRGIATQRRVPHPHTLMDFYTTYTDSGRTRAIDLLRTRYFRLNYPAASILLWTEMVADYREEQYLQVLSTFCHNFYMAGVPRAKVVTALKNMPPGRHRAIPSRGKLYPLPIQSALIWQCLASLETHLDSLEKLYWELLDACRGKYQVGPHDMFKGVNEINNPAWKGLPVAESAFTPFLKKLMRHSGVSRGIRMLNDMAEVGLAPTIYHYTEVAAYAAKIRDNRTAFFILGKMEESWGARPEAEIDASHLQEDYTAFDFTLDAPEKTDGTWDTASEEVPSPPAGTNPSGTISPLVESSRDASPSINVPSNVLTNAALTPEISAEPLFVDTIPSPSLGINETTPSEEAPASPVDVSAPISPNPSFVFYVAVMRGFLMSREMAALQEVHNHFLRFYDPETLDDEHLNLLYDDWRTVLAGERYPTRLPKRVLNMLQNE